MSDVSSAYNKGKVNGTLLGNWVEENALKSATGQSRYKEWTTLETPENIRLTRSMKRGPDGTSARVIGTYSNAVEPKDYKASSKTGIPQKAPEYARNNTVGPRALGRKKVLYNAAKEITENSMSKHSASNNSQDYTTTSRSNYCTKSNNQNQNKDTEDFRKLREFNKSFNADTPVTIYSHSITKANGVSFPITSMNNSGNPFSKSTAFTNDIRDAQKTHAEATAPGYTNPVNPGITASQKIILQKLKSFVFTENFRGFGVSFLRNYFKKCDQNAVGSLNSNQFIECLEGSGICLTRHEVSQILLMLDPGSTGTISYTIFLELLSIPTDEKKVKVIKLAFDFFDKNHAGYIMVDDLLTRFDSNSCEQILNGSPNIPSKLTQLLIEPPGANYLEGSFRGAKHIIYWDDWKEFYCDVGNVIDDLDLFQNLVFRMWNITM